MSLNYKNPISPISFLGNSSVPRDQTYGTNYSVLSTGGYMEVYSLSDLNYQIPSGNTGLIEYSANTIPIQFNKGLGTIFSPDVLTLHSDNISSGRRKLGMLVYVYETDKIYQHTIDNYDLLWTAATNASGPGGQTVVISEFGTTIKNNSVAGQNFINVWTASTIEGVSGYTNLNATWRVLQTGGGGTFTGGTVTGDTIFTSGLTANTFSASTYLGLPADIFITGGTFDTSTDTLTLERSSGSTITITGFTDYYTTAFTYSSNTLTIYNNSGNTFPVTINDFTGLTINGSLSANTISATTYQNLPIDPDTYITGFTYSSNTFTILDNSGNTFPVTVNDFTGLTINGDLSATTISGGTFYGDGSNLVGVNFTGGTVSGGTLFLSGLTATTISASTYQNLPIDPDTYVTGFTYSANTFTIYDNSGNTFNATINDVTGLTVNGTLTVTGDTNVDGLTANTISATTYLNLPTDFNTYVTGFTYSSNTFTILDNSGNTFDATFNDVTGLTINGNLNVTGNTSLDGLTATTISATTYQNLPIDPDTYVTGFTYSANTFSITNNSGTTLNATINEVTGFTVNGIFNVSGATSTFTNSAPNSTVAQFYIGSSGNAKFINFTNPSKYIGINETSVVGVNIGTGANSFTIYGASSSVAVNAEGGSPVYLQNGVQFSTGNVIIGSLADPGYKLFVSGNTLVTGTTVTQNFRMTSGATNGYVLLSDSLGNGIWSPQSGITNVPISGITGLQSELNNKYDKSGGTVNGDVVVTGNVTILGTATTINTETLSVEDNLITLNSNYTGSTVPFFGDSGIEILRGSATTASLIWNESSQYWQAGLTGTTKQIILSGDSLSLLNSGHTHPISEIDNLQSSLNNKLDLTGGTLNGDLSLVNLSANTITATTIDLCANNGTLYTDSISGCSPINILSTSIFNDGLSANTISGGTLYGDGSGLTNLPSFTSTTSGSFGINVSNGNSSISTGFKGFVKIPYGGVITSWTIMSTSTGSTNIDIWKDSQINFPPTSADTITGGNYVNLSNQSINSNNFLVGWTTNFSANDIFAFEVISVSGVTNLNLTINVIKN